MLDDFLAILAGEQPTQTVWTADLSYWITGQQQAGKASPAWQNEEGYLQLHQKLGVMPYYFYEKFWVAEASYEPSVKVSTASDGNSQRTTGRPQRAV